METYGEELRKFRFAQYIMLIGNFLLPALAFIDYQNGHIEPTIAKIIAWFISIYGSYYCLYIRKDDQRINYLLAVTLFVFPVVGIIYKGDHIMGVIWSPVLPLLYMYLANLRWGIIFSAAYWLFELTAYWLVPFYLNVERYPLMQWVMINLVYLIAFVLAFLYELLNNQQAKLLRALAEVDQLTQLLNRHGFIRALQRESRRSVRHGSPLSLIIFDLDNFKTVNDGHGHNTGDRLLREIAGALVEWLRESDIAGRWGGEEFVVLLPETRLGDAAEVAQKLCNRLAVQAFIEVGHVTASFGVTHYRDRESIEAFIERADQLMYRAKAMDKNCVVVGEDE